MVLVKLHGPCPPDDRYHTPEMSLHLILIPMHCVRGRKILGRISDARIGYLFPRYDEFCASFLRLLLRIKLYHACPPVSHG